MKNFTMQTKRKMMVQPGRNIFAVIFMAMFFLLPGMLKAQDSYFAGFSTGNAANIKLFINGVEQTYVDDGWIQGGGTHGSTNQNYLAAYTASNFATGTFRNYFVFTRTGSGTITSASLQVNSFTVFGSVTFNLTAVTGYTASDMDANRSNGDATGQAIFAAIGNGTSLGSLSNPASSTIYTINLSNLSALENMGSTIIIGGRVENTSSYTAPVLTTNAATSVSATAATLNGSLTANSNSGSYYFQYGTTGSYGSTTTSTAYSSNATMTANLTGLSSGTTYYYRAYATVSGHSDVYGSQQSFSTPPANPSGITGTTTICNGSGTTLTATGIDGTAYWYSGSCGGTYVGTGNSITVYPTTNTSYYVKNYKNALYSAGCASATVTVNNPATVPASATVTSVTENTANLSWDASSGTPTITHYWVVGTSSSVVYGTVGQNGVIAQGTTDVSTTTAIATGLSPSTNYYFRVFANSTASPCGASAYRTSAMFTTVPSAPAAGAATNIRANSFSANWSAATGATKYFLDVSTSNTFSSFVAGFENKDVGNVVTYSITGLNNTTTYYYRVRAYNSGGISVSSTPAISATTLPVNNFLIEQVGGGNISDQLAGTAFSIKITARDEFNTTVSDFTGTVSITSNSDLTAGGTTAAFTAGILSSHSVTLTGAGTGMHLTASIGSPEVSTNSNDFTVLPASINYFTLAVNGTVTAGTPFTVTATVYDEFGNVKTNYEGQKSVNWTTTAISSPNGTARIIPANGDQTFVAGVATIGGFTFYNSDQSQLAPYEGPTITITDAPTSSPGTTAPITVLNATLANFRVVAGTEQSSGIAFSTTVTARDVYWNTCVDYAGSIRFKSSDDALVTFPAGLQSFAPASTYHGVRTFTNAILINVMGAYWLRAADAAFAYKSGEQQNIIVGPGTFSPSATYSTLTISDPLTPTNFVDPLARVAGEYVLVTATPRDAQGNLLYACRNITIYLKGSATHRNGEGNTSIAIPVTNVGDGSYTALVRVSETGTNLITASFDDYVPVVFFGQTRTVNVSPAPVDLAHTLITAVPTTMTTDEHSDITVQLKDVFDNNRTTSGGTVTLQTTKGILTSVTDNSDGTYTSVLNGNYGAVGTALITGQLVGADITDTESVVINEGLPALATIQITANPEVITTNQTSTISVQLKDQFGNLVTTNRGTVTLSTDKGQLSSVVYTSLGIYQSTLSGFNPGFGPATITGKYNGGDIADNATVTFNEGLADLAHIEITASPTTMTSDGSSEITVQLKDIWGNNITTSRGTIALSATIGALTAVTDHGDGTYTATLTGDNRGFGNSTITGTLTGAVSGNITDNAVVVITEGKPDLADITLTPASGTMTTDETRLITVQLKDQFGNNLTTSRGTINLATSLTGTALTAVTDNEDGTYEATLSTTVTGTATITGHLDDVTDGIDGNISDDAVVVIGEGKPALAQIQITVSDDNITTDETSTITVQLRDQWGNNLSTQRGTVALASSDHGSIGTVSYAGNGTYTATLSGDYRGVGSPYGVGLTTISGILTDTDDGVTGDITDNATVTFTEGLPNLANSDLTVFKTTMTTDESCDVTMYLKDKWGNYITHSRGDVTFVTSIGAMSATTDGGNGIYSATITGDTRGVNGTGTAAISASFAGAGTAAAVVGDFEETGTLEITEGLPALATTTITANPTTMTVDETSTITVQLKDQFGNLITHDRSTVALSTNLGSLSSVTAGANDGVYTAILSGSNPGVGTATLTGTLAGVVEGTIVDNATVEITEGLPFLLNTVMSSWLQSITTDESTTVTFQLRDQFNNNITHSRGTVTMSTTLGQLTAVTDNDNGTYTATLSANNTGVGDAVISGTLNSYSFGKTLTIPITEGLPNLAQSTITANPTTITTDGSSLITLQLKDQWGNNIINNRGTVALETNLGVLTTAAYTSLGRYTATLTANATGTGLATISGSFVGAVSDVNPDGNFVDEAEVTITEGLPDLTKIQITASPTSITADQTSTITIQLQDQWGNLLTSSRGSIALSSADLTGTQISSVTDNGNGTYTATFSMNAYGTGTATISGIFTGSGDASEVIGSVSDQATIEVSHGVATKLAMKTQPSSTAIAGVDFAQQPVVYIQDQFGNTVLADNSTLVTAAIATGTSTLYSTGVLTATASSGIATFGGLYYTKAETITLGFSTTPIGYGPNVGLTGVSSSEIVVGHAPIDHFTLNSPANFTAGASRAAYTVTRYDVFENLVTTGTQVTYLYSSSTGANKKFYNAASSGSVITQLTIADGASTANFWYYDEKTGDHIITASDNPETPDGEVNINDGTDQVTVTPALLKDFIVYGVDNPHDFGIVQSVTVEARDTYNNRKTNYIGTITFSNTDVDATNPADYHFQLADAGIHTFTDAVMFSQPGSWWITAIDLAEPTKYGAQANIIVQRAVEIVANDRTKTYGDVLTMGTTDFTVNQIVPGNSTYGPVAGEITGVTLTSTGSAALADVGDYSIIPSLATGPYNPAYYRIVYSEEGMLRVNPAELTITADAYQTKVYGESDPAFTYEASGFKNSQTVSIITGNLVRETGENVANDYAILIGSLSAGSNYEILYLGANFSITPKPVTVIATVGQSKIYGQLDPTFAYTSNVPLAFSDVFVGALARTSGENVASDYALNIGSLSIENGSSVNVASNYTISFTTADFAITPLAIAVTADAGQSKTYGDLDPTFSYTSVPAVGSSLPNGHTIAFTGSLTRAAGEPVGTYAINQGSLDNGNYDITYTSNLFTINKLGVTLTADAGQSKEYGNSDPTFTYTSVPAVGFELANGILISYTGALVRVAGENVGNYAIGQGTVDNSNYTINFVSNNFAITRKAIAITVTTGQNKVYGANDPTFAYTTSPLVSALPFTASFTGALVRETGEVVGTEYTITQGTLELIDANNEEGGSLEANYTITFNTADFEITRKPITITVDEGIAKLYGADDPEFTYTSSPALGSLPFNASWTGSLERMDGDQNVGTYTITQGSLELSDSNNGTASLAQNYTVTFVNTNVLTISKRPITVVVDANQSKVYAESDPVFTYTPSIALYYNGAFTGTLTRATGENVATNYAISRGTLNVSDDYNATTSLDDNYDLTFTPANFAITKKPITITVNSGQQKVYGNSDPVFTYVSSVDPLPFEGSFTGTLVREAGNNVATGYAISRGSLQIEDINHLTSLDANYNLNFVGADFEITRRPITLTASDRTKTYGDLLDLGNTQFGITGDGMAYEETISTVELSSLGTPVQANVGTYAIATANAVGANGYLVSNYDVTYSTAGTLTVGVRTLNLSYFGADSKVYDGNTVATGIGFMDDRIPGDYLSFQRDAAFDTKDAGTNKPVYYTNIAITGGSDMLNYVLASTTGTAYADIYPKALTVTANDDSRLYSGSPYTGGNGVTYSGFITGEDAANLEGTLTYGGTSQGATEVGDYIITPGGYTPGNYSFTYVNGNLSIFASLSVSGTFKYYNTARTPLNNVTVQLKQGASVIAETTTNALGEYTFTNVSNGTYDVIASSSLPIPNSESNATDALLVYLNSGAFAEPLEKVRFYAGDAGNPLNNKLQTGDASKIIAHFNTNGASPYGRANWTFWNAGDLIYSNPLTTNSTLAIPQVTVLNNSLIADFFGLATGDFNMSFTPGGAKSGYQSLTLKQEQIVPVSKGDVFELPVSAGMGMEVGAISMILNFPADRLELLDIYLNDGKNTPVDFAVNGNEVRMSWFSDNAILLNPDDKIFTLKVRSTSSIAQDETIRFELNTDPNNELADVYAKVIEGAVLKIAEIGASGPASELSLSNFPNPFSHTTNFVYTLPVDGRVTLEISNMLGSAVKMVVNETQKAGSYQLHVLTSDLNPGIYTATLRVTSPAGTQARTIKIICNQ